MEVLCANWKTLVRAYKKCRKVRNKTLADNRILRTTGEFVFSDQREARNEFREALRLFVSALTKFAQVYEEEI